MTDEIPGINGSFPIMAIAKHFDVDLSLAYLYADGMHPRFDDQTMPRSPWLEWTIDEITKVFPFGDGAKDYHAFHQAMAQVSYRLRP